jgi:hypothetical protein
LLRKGHVHVEAANPNFSIKGGEAAFTGIQERILGARRPVETGTALGAAAKSGSETYWNRDRSTHNSRRE